MPRKNIVWAGDLIRHSQENVKMLDDGTISPQVAHAQHAAISRAMYVVNTFIRYDRALKRGEVRKLTFMHKPGVKK